MYFGALNMGISANQPHRILVAPLDWGLGHATRCVPLIDRWLAAGHEVLLASNGRSAAWLANRYPNLELHTDIPDYAITYPASGGMTLHFAKHFFRLKGVIEAERRWLHQFVEKNTIHQVCSDNRYGLYHPDVPCSIITHQLYLRVPLLVKPLVQRLLRKQLTAFDHVWVPDVATGDGLSGALSHGGPLDEAVQYIGPLSRFHAASSSTSTSAMKVVAIVSGPEPTRTLFEQQLRALLPQLPCNSLLVLGKPDEHVHEEDGNLTVRNHLDDAELAVALRGAELIIVRSGYSTLMDLAVLNLNALLVPTPGQTEQEYLAKYHSSQGNHRMVRQHKLSLEVLHSALQR
jgi:UDP:flavonoid glycosyltransferase YjiC (YdhE family)